MAKVQRSQESEGRIKLFGAMITLHGRKAINEKGKGSEEDEDQTVEKRTDHKIIACPRCKSMETKFCYFNNYNVNQPRHFCKSCNRYWTAGGALRNVPVGAGRRKLAKSPPCHGADGLIEGSNNCNYENSNDDEQNFGSVSDEWHVSAAPQRDFRQDFPVKRRRTSPAQS